MLLFTNIMNVKNIDKLRDAHMIIIDLQNAYFKVCCYRLVTVDFIVGWF